MSLESKIQTASFYSLFLKNSFCSMWILFIIHLQQYHPDFSALRIIQFSLFASKSVFSKRLLCFSGTFDATILSKSSHSLFSILSNPYLSSLGQNPQGFYNLCLFLTAIPNHLYSDSKPPFQFLFPCRNPRIQLCSVSSHMPVFTLATFSVFLTIPVRIRSLLGPMSSA